MTPLSQISMKFVDESPQPEDAPLLKEDQPVNVGLRLKKLKTAENTPVTEEPAEPDTELIVASVDEEVQITDPVLKIKSGRGRKSIRQISEEADLIQIPEDEVLFQKHYYSMGEVADMFRVNQTLLRF